MILVDTGSVQEQEGTCPPLLKKYKNDKSETTLRSSSWKAWWSHSLWAKENFLWEQKGLQPPFALSFSMGKRELSLEARRVSAALCSLTLYGQKRTLFGSKKGYRRPLLSQLNLKSWVVEPLSLNLRPVSSSPSWSSCQRHRHRDGCPTPYLQAATIHEPLWYDNRYR